ncbi:MAG: ATP-binding protein [Dehalococcoidales bacterium]|nr:ATP-binding protein [Dehalococcoidales bacterium]
MKEGDIGILNEIAELEKTWPFSTQGGELGWSFRDVRKQPAVLNRLFLEGLLDNPFKSNSYTGYRLSELGRRAVETGEQPETTEMETEKLEIPDDLFDVIEGYNDIKQLIGVVLRSEKPVHLLFTGVPASAKTMFLMELSRLGAPYIIGSQSSRAGIADLLFDAQPQILLVDEIDRIGTKDISVLLSLMATGIVSETKHSKQRSITIDTRVFAACNTLRLAPELISRFMVLEFKPYSLNDFLTVSTNILVKHENISPDLAAYIGQQTWQFPSRFPDPRQAVRIARLAKTKKEVDDVLELLRRHGAGLTK